MLFIKSNFRNCFEYATKANLTTINEKFKNVRTNEMALISTPVTLKLLTTCFSQDEVCMYIEPWIINLGEYLNKGALHAEQIEETAKMIYETAQMLNLCELNLFFKRVKSAKYGAFYTFDGQPLMLMLNQFLEDRQRAVVHLIQENDKLSGRLDIRGAEIASIYANRIKEKEAEEAKNKQNA